MSKPPYLFKARYLIKHTDKFATHFVLPFVDSGLVRVFVLSRNPNSKPLSNITTVMFKQR
jgi:hypothetical protein